VNIADVLAEIARRLEEKRRSGRWRSADFQIRL